MSNTVDPTICPVWGLIVFRPLRMMRHVSCRVIQYRVLPSAELHVGDNGTTAWVVAPVFGTAVGAVMHTTEPVPRCCCGVLRMAACTTLQEFGVAANFAADGSLTGLAGVDEGTGFGINRSTADI